MVHRERRRVLRGGKHTALSESRPPAPFLSVVIPTRGDPSRLSTLLTALEKQTLPPAEREIILCFDGAEATPDIARRAKGLEATLIATTERRGPGAARNQGARNARGDYLAFTEDDCTPADDWLERAAARLKSEPEIDVLEGATVQPDGRPTRRGGGNVLHYLPTNLIVRRQIFERVGGYFEGFFDRERGIYFREDSDFGFAVEESGARVAHESSARVEHPAEHAGFLDPLRWARRYEMDALLRARHPRLFRERIETVRLGPFALRRPLMRISWIFVLTLAAVGIAVAAGRTGIAAGFGVMAALMLLPVWAKWRFHPVRLPVLPFVPLVLVYAEARGYFRRRAAL